MKAREGAISEGVQRSSVTSGAGWLAAFLLAVAACSGSNGGGPGAGGGKGGQAAGGAPAGGGHGGLSTGGAGVSGGGGRAAGGGAAGAFGDGGAGGDGVHGFAGMGGGAGAAGAAGVTGASGGGGGSSGPAGRGGAVAAGGGGGTGTAGGAGGGGLGGAAVSGPVHDRCRDPLPLQFVDGQVSVSDNLGSATDEFPTLVCGPGASEVASNGGQIYYRFTARAGMKYELRLDAPAFDGDTFYVFPAAAACTVEAIHAACTSGGETGTFRATISSSDLTPFAPREPGDYVVAVDSQLMAGRVSYPRLTLTIFEYCAAAGAPGAGGCKTEVCHAGLDRSCDGNVSSVCNADGTAYVTTDCAATGASCSRGACVATVVDNIGSFGWSSTGSNEAGAAGLTLLDFFTANASRTLTQIDSTMTQSKSVPLRWLVLEAANQVGPYAMISSTTTTSSATGTGVLESSGPLRVPLVAGRFYAVGVAVPAGAGYQTAQQGTSHLPVDLFFGTLTSAAVLPTASPGSQVSYPTPGTFVVAERLTTSL